MKRAGLWTLLVIGAALIAMPLATGMFTKASAGQRMMKDFEPIMTVDSVRTTAAYYQLFQGVGTDFGPVMTPGNVARFQTYMKGLDGMSADMQSFMASFGKQMHMTPAQVQTYMRNNYPSLAAMLAGLPRMRADMGGMVGVMATDAKGFGQVAPALRHFQTLVGVMQRNVHKYASANSLPPMGLLPWFFAGPGIAIVLLSGWLLLAGRPVEIEEVAALPHMEVPARAA